MQPKLTEKALAIELRRRGLSYAEIQEKVPVSQSSLSLWLRGIELSEAHAQRLAKKKLVGQLLGAKKVHEARLNRIGVINREAQAEAVQRLSSMQS